MHSNFHSIAIMRCAIRPTRLSWTQQNKRSFVVLCSPNESIGLAAAHRMIVHRTHLNCTLFVAINRVRARLSLPICLALLWGINAQTHTHTNTEYAYFRFWQSVCARAACPIFILLRNLHTFAFVSTARPFIFHLLLAQSQKLAWKPEHTRHGVFPFYFRTPPAVGERAQKHMSMNHGAAPLFVLFLLLCTANTGGTAAIGCHRIVVETRNYALLIRVCRSAYRRTRTHTHHGNYTVFIVYRIHRHTHVCYVLDAMPCYS